MSDQNLSMSPFWVLLFTYLGPLCSTGQQVSSVWTAYGIVEKRSVGKFSVIPFASLLVNSFVWLVYAVMRFDIIMISSNLIGVLCGLYCLWAFHSFASVKPIKEYFVVVIILGSSLLFANLEQTETIGFIGCMLSVMLSGSPLAVVGTVIQEKSTASLPFTTSFITWMGNLAWIGYGFLLVNDPWLYVPNIIGSVLSSIQLLLFLIYPSKTDAKLEDLPSLQ